MVLCLIELEYVQQTKLNQTLVLNGKNIRCIGI